jgi:hypothetical protein
MISFEQGDFSVIGFSENSKIGNIIIESISINMVDVFPCFESPSKMFFHYVAMEPRAFPVNADVFVLAPSIPSGSELTLKRNQNLFPNAFFGAIVGTVYSVLRYIKALFAQQTSFRDSIFRTTNFFVHHDY